MILNQYRLSAIISVYNCQDHIFGCLQNLENQSIFKKIEVIAVDTGSAQNERKIISEFQRRHDNIKYIRINERKTIYEAWNIGIKASTSPFLTNANSDDRHRYDALEVMVKTLDTNPDIDVVYPKYIFTAKKNQTFENHAVLKYYDPPVYSREELLFRCIPHCQPVWRKNIHCKYGYFREDLKVAGDHEFWLRISKTCQFRKIDAFLGLCLKHDQNATFRNFSETVREVAKVTNEYIDNVYCPEHKADKKRIRKIRKRQSMESCSRAETMLRFGLRKDAFRFAVDAMKYNYANLYSLKLAVWAIMDEKRRNFARRILKRSLPI